MENIHPYENSEIIEEIKDFIDRNKDVYETNIEDFKISKNISSGNGFALTNKANVWKRERAHVSANLLEPIVNNITYTYTNDPFDFKGLKDVKELTFQLSNVLRETVIDGISYLLVGIKESGELTYQRLKNFNLMYDQLCNYSDGADAKGALYVEKIPTNKDQSHAGCFYSSLTTMINLKPKEKLECTYWRKVEDGVETFKLEGEEIVGYVKQGLSRIPVVRFYGKKVEIDFQENFRGLYYLVKDLLISIDYYFSYLQEKIACAPNHLYEVAEETIGNNLTEWQVMNDIPRPTLTYKGMNGQTPLPPPRPNSYRLEIEPLLNVIRFHMDCVNFILGNNAGTGAVSESVESVLMKRENKLASVNEFIKNLLDASEEITTLIHNFTGIETTVVSSLFDKLKKAETLNHIQDFISFTTTNPNAKFFAVSMIKNLDIDEETKEDMLNGLANSEVPDQKLLEAEQAINELKNQIQIKELELTQANATKEAQLVSAQVKEQGLITRKRMDLEHENQVLMLKISELAQKYNISMAEIEKDMQIKSAELNQKQQEIDNDFNNKTREMILKATGG